MNDFVKTRKKKIALLASLLATVMLFAMVFIGVEFENHEDEEELIRTPVLSTKSGFYEDDLQLEITAPEGTKIFYSLDCSEPDENAIEYTGPIQLSDATANDNVFSMNTDVSTGFYKDLIDSVPKFYDTDVAPGYSAPDYNVDKCNVVRAIAIDSIGRKSEIVTGSYFVGISPARYDECNIVSIVTDPDNLFGDEKGIYVTGNTFKEYLESGEIGVGYSGQRWKTWKANYRNRGNDWEREATINAFASDGKLLSEEDLGIRIGGRTSRGIIPKSLKIYAREKYDGNDVFKYAYHNDGKKNDCLMFSGGGTKPITQFSDYAMSQKVSGLNFATMKFEPYVMFLDGEYWGYYWLETRYDAKYLANYYGVKESNVVVVKEGEVSAGNSDSQILYDEMVAFISDNNMTLESNYKRACNLIDIDSFIDYFAMQIYIARKGDWPTYNFSLWRTLDVKSDKYSDGKWRWMLYDDNSYAMTKDLINENTLDYVIGRDDMFASLWENEDFREKFQKRIFEIADECFDENEMASFIDEFETEMYPRMEKSWARFYGSENDKGELFKKSMAGYKLFFAKRRTVVESWFKE